MRINHNISALRANTQLTKNDNSLSKSLEKLTSGLKINHAADDAAGMAISQKMKTQIRGLTRASANASDGISVIQTAEGALTEVETMLQRMRELAVQAANGTNTEDDRAAIQEEIEALNAEITRISDTTEFNTKALLNGDIDRKTFTNNSKINIIKISDEVAVSDYQLKVTSDARQAVIVGAPFDPDPSKEIKEEQAGKITINEVDVEVNEGDTYDEVLTKIRDACSNSGITCFTKDAYANPGYSKDNAGSAGYEITQATFSNSEGLLFVSENYGSDEEITLVCDNEELGKIFGIGHEKIEAKGIDAKAQIMVEEDGFSSTATVTTNGNKVSITDLSGFEMVVEVEPFTAGTSIDDEKVPGASNGANGGVARTDEEVSAKVTVLSSGPLSIHIGANEYQTMSVRIPKVTPKTLGIDTINITTGAGAQKAINLVSNAINEVSSIRAKLGAYQNRLDYAIENLDTSSENMTEALSRIEDTDMAGEMATYTQYSVLTQAGTSMLAQANQRPQNILSLLQS